MIHPLSRTALISTLEEVCQRVLDLFFSPRALVVARYYAPTTPLAACQKARRRHT